MSGGVTVQSAPGVGAIAKGANIVCAATITLVPSTEQHVTGSTGPVTDIDFSPAFDGAWGWVIFDSTPTLTHNATTLKLPGGANIPVAAGDRALFFQDSGDNVICLDYICASGQPVIGTQPASSTDTAVARYNGTGGNLQDSALLVDGTGNITAFGGQMVFPASQNASAGANTFDDYEEGTFTPAWSASGATFSYFSQVGTYTKVGNRVIFSHRIAINSGGNTVTANALSATGLPFTANASPSTVGFPIDFSGATTSYVSLMANLAGGATSFTFDGLTAAATGYSQNLLCNAVLSNAGASTHRIHGHYAV